MLRNNGPGSSAVPPTPASMETMIIASREQKGTITVQNVNPNAASPSAQRVSNVFHWRSLWDKGNRYGPHRKQRFFQTALMLRFTSCRAHAQESVRLLLTSPPIALSPPPHGHHVVTFHVRLVLVLALVVELAEEVEGHDGVEVNNDCQQTHRHHQLWKDARRTGGVRWPTCPMMTAVRGHSSSSKTRLSPLISCGKQVSSPASQPQAYLPVPKSPTCLPLCVTDERMVRNVLTPMAMSRRWQAKKKLL